MWAKMTVDCHRRRSAKSAITICIVYRFIYLDDRIAKVFCQQMNSDMTSFWLGGRWCRAGEAESTGLTSIHMQLEGF